MPAKLAQLPDAADASPERPDTAGEIPCLSRREAVRRVGEWVIYVGVLGALADCGPATPAPASTCGCTATPSGTNTLLNATNLPANSVAYNPSLRMFIANDSGQPNGGFYAMTSICTHLQCNIATTSGSVFNAGNLAGGFKCGCHGSGYDANGNVTHGPSTSPLAHFQLAVDNNGDFWVDSGNVVGSSCRCASAA